MTLGGLLVVALGAWIYGRWSVPSKGAFVRRISMVFAAISIVFGVWILMPSSGLVSADAGDGLGGPDEQDGGDASKTGHGWSRCVSHRVAI